MLKSLLAVFMVFGLTVGCRVDPVDPSGLKQVFQKGNSSGWQPDAAFWKHWGDGQAEVSVYDLEIKRYGEWRRGWAVLIYVTEPFRTDLLVKAEGSDSKAPAIAAMKLNWIERFQTGIYDYSLMTSGFLALESTEKYAAGSLMKATFSGQEWCGHVWSQLILRPPHWHFERHSYFEREADQQTQLEHVVEGEPEEVFWFWCRGIGEARARTGEKVELMVLPGLYESRLQHRRLRWQRAVVEYQQVGGKETPAGNFTVDRYVVVRQDGRKLEFLLGREFPHLVVGWDFGDQRAVLKRTRRLAYWKLHDRDSEKWRHELGL